MAYAGKGWTALVAKDDGTFAVADPMDLIADRPPECDPEVCAPDCEGTPAVTAPKKPKKSLLEKP